MVKHKNFLELTLNAWNDSSTPLVDVRDEIDFILSHDPKATNIPLKVIESCWHELPPKGTALTLIINGDQQAIVEDIFERQDYPLIQIISAENCNQDSWISGTKSQRFWRANPLLEQYIDLIKSALSEQELSAIDIASGSGRDDIFLSMHGFNVTAVDNNEYALKRLAAFSERYGCSVEIKNLDLKSDKEQLKTLIQTLKPKFLNQARYLNRDLLQDYKDWLERGAIVAIHTFFEEAANFGKPKNPEYLLARNELAEAFSNWDILVDEVHYLPDGRPLSLFLAQKA